MPEPLSIDDVMAWLQTKAMRARNPADLLTGLGDRLCAADLPLSAMTLGITTLHPLMVGAVFTWHRGHSTAIEAPLFS